MTTSKARKGREFEPELISKLAERVAFMCSNPDCRRLTVNASPEGEGSIRTGQAAHIHSAGNGPRFKEGMTDDECRAFANGIWLCNVCSRLIDKGESKYTPDLLLKWKQDAEVYVAELVTQDARLRQLQAMMEHVLSALRILTAMPGPGSQVDKTFESEGRIGIIRTLIEAEQLLFERGFRREANIVLGIHSELLRIYDEIHQNQQNEHLDISGWKNAMVKSVMLEVMRFSKESYERYLATETKLIKERCAYLKSIDCTIRPCAVAHRPSVIG
jgi:hypothetical protein